MLKSHLSSNYFHGYLPKGAGLSIDVFNGDIPLWFGALHKVKYFILNNNTFIGTIPPTLANMSNLEILDLGHNLIQGKIPFEIGEIGDFRKLKMFHVGYNQLFGSIPSSFFNIYSLQLISLTKTTLSSSKLPCMSLDSNLEVLYLGGNYLNGNIPHCISNASKLKILKLNQNSFSRLIPITLGDLMELSFFIGKLRNLSVLDISFNPLNGILPTFISNFSTSLQEFHVMVCKIKGTILMEIGSLSNIRVLQLAQNEFRGSIPRSIENLIRLEEIYFYKNSLEGKILHFIF
ncbi:Serine-threonine protein kinase [Theobroma cacao]|uniref:Serine-threonine protein kinase n=1 Tax=Theobroma cacao TaxID=3641 RepID=A0A061FR33_THECC|nr:Serine-threonine protein kinase [Theobroma cacao]